MIYAFFPLVAAALYGLNYVLIEHVTQKINLTTYYVVGWGISLFVSVGLAFAHGWVRHEPVQLATLRESPIILLLLVVSAFLGTVAWMFTTYALKNISAHYAAFGEISYPLFTLLFAWLLFGTRHFDMTTVIGGLLIMAGSFLLIYGQTRVQQ